MIIHDDSTERAAGNESGPAHPSLAPLSRAEAAHLVRLSLEAAADHALLARYDGGGALSLRLRSEVTESPPAEHFEAGLSNLARIVAGQRPDHWPRLVGEHFDRLAHTLRQGPPPRPADPSRELFQRLAAKDSLEPRMLCSAPEFVPGLLSVPATATDGTIAMYFDPLADLGLTWAEAESHGLRNLRSLTDTVAYAEYEGTQVAMISGSDFAASRALVLDTVLRESLHVENPQYGVLAAMPVRDLLLVHVITDLSVLPALGMMLNLAGRSHAIEPGPLSPWVYLVAADGWQLATRAADDPGLSPRFVALMHQLDEAS
ncbi:hypothetical protein [Streptomyces sp. SID13031]|uniref:hypothetical protein n=1 Tax=Streptomyces sp. SID13031 TaxID=2706046 RepID=UPI0019435D42|nr:hypothetical protein [Streptomyces sp. SID13031]